MVSYTAMVGLLSMAADGQADIVRVYFSIVFWLANVGSGVCFTCGEQPIGGPASATKVQLASSGCSFDIQQYHFVGGY